MTAKEIISRLRITRYVGNCIVLPNYTPPGWWECDLCEITEAGYFREYEVKISRADFFADARKERSRFCHDAAGEWQRTTEKKHESIFSNPVKSPSRFWYVTPAGLVQPSELPAFAGLIEMVQTAQSMYEKEAVKAPWIHRRKVDDAMRLRALQNAHGRYHWLLATR